MKNLVRCVPFGVEVTPEFKEEYATVSTAVHPILRDMLKWLPAYPGEKLTMRYQSYARWNPEDVPPGVLNSQNETTDEHDTEADAQAVVNLLKRNGFAGLGVAFPIEERALRPQEIRNWCYLFLNSLGYTNTEHGGP